MASPAFTVALKLLGIIVLLGAVLFVALDREDSETVELEALQTLRVGVLPDQSPQTLRTRFAPFLAYLSKYLEIPVELVVPESYARLLELFHNKEVDFAYMGAYSFVRARQQDAAIPLVMRRIDTRFTSLFVVSAENPAQTLDDLRGQRLGFGSFPIHLRRRLVETANRCRGSKAPIGKTRARNDPC